MLYYYDEGDWKQYVFGWWCTCGPRTIGMVGLVSWDPNVFHLVYRRDIIISKIKCNASRTETTDQFCCCPDQPHLCSRSAQL